MNCAPYQHRHWVVEQCRQNREGIKVWHHSFHTKAKFSATYFPHLCVWVWYTVIWLCAILNLYTHTWHMNLLKAVLCDHLSQQWDAREPWKNICNYMQNIQFQWAGFPPFCPFGTIILKKKKQQTLLEKSGTIVSNMAIELQMDYIFLYRELVFDKILFCNITFFNLTFVHLYFGHI